MDGGQMSSLQSCLDLSVIGLWSTFFYCFFLSSLWSLAEKGLLSALAKCEHSWNFHYGERQAKELIEQSVCVSALQGRPYGTELEEMFSSASWLYNISWAMKSVYKLPLRLYILTVKSRHEYFRRKVLSFWVPTKETMHLFIGLIKMVRPISENQQSSLEQIHFMLCIEVRETLHFSIVQSTLETAQTT